MYQNNVRISIAPEIPHMGNNLRISSKINTVNNTVLYVWKLLKEYILNVLSTRKKIQLCAVMSVN